MDVSDPTSLVPTLGPSGVLLLVVVWLVRGFFTGLLVSRKTHEDLMQERDTWRQTALTWQAGQQESTAQMATLTEAVRALSAAPSLPGPYWLPPPPSNGTVGRHAA